LDFKFEKGLNNNEYSLKENGTIKDNKGYDEKMTNGSKAKQSLWERRM
jgi:hypothetical protein